MVGTAGRLIISDGSSCGARIPPCSVRAGDFLGVEDTQDVLCDACCEVGRSELGRSVDDVLGFTLGDGGGRPRYLLLEKGIMMGDRYVEAISESGVLRSARWRCCSSIWRYSCVDTSCQSANGGESMEQCRHTQARIDTGRDRSRERCTDTDRD